MAISFKVYLVVGRQQSEIRKFSIEEDLAKSFHYVLEKIQRTFSDSLLRSDLEVTWKDEENDLISISSDAELVQAFESIENGILKLYVKVKKAKSETPEKEHVGVTCDGCNVQISGTRFKCTVCFDFDLCTDCHKKGEHPVDHEMLCIRQPRNAGHPVYYGQFPFGPFRGRGFHCGRPRGARGCPRRQEKCQEAGKQPEADKKTTEEEDKQKKCEQAGCEDMIRNAASAFGLDPEVAVSSMNNMCEELQKSAEKPPQQGATADNQEAFPLEGMIKQFTDMFGVDSQAVTQNIQALFQHHHQQQQQQQQNLENHQQQSEPKEQQQATTEQQQQNEPTTVETDKSDDVEMKETASGSQQQTDDQMFNIFKESSDPQASNGFVLVDKQSPQEQATRIERSLRQMEAMGFKNEGGWLRQLLVSKNGSIDKVLEALNPAQ